MSTVTTRLNILEVGNPPPQPPEPPTYRTTAAPVHFGAGFYDEENNQDCVFQWMGLEAQLELAPSPEARFLELQAFCEFLDLSQVLTTKVAGTQQDHALYPGWSKLSIAVPADAEVVDLHVNKLFPPEYYPDDSRSLAISLRSPFLHRDPERHRHIVAQATNSVDNLREMLGRKVTLQSSPPNLGIDLYGICNVKPPCVYCEWDWNKELEGDNVDAPFTVETLDQWGSFFERSSSLVNCSIGEPFMMKDFDGLLDRFGDFGKYLEMTTNGQILTERNIQKLLGRDIHLYISLDAGTEATYAKLRNDKFDRILVNLRRLIEAKGGREGLPKIHLVFMPMKVNVHELDTFIELCADLEIDRMVLRPLNYSPSVSLDWERAGHHFVYQDELLPFDELVRVSGRAAELCRQLGVPLDDQMDFGGSMEAQFEGEFDEGRQQAKETGAEQGDVAEPAATEENDAGLPEARLDTASSAEETGDPEPPVTLPSLGAESHPVCQEPWKSQYILRRGVFPCCYGGAPIAPMDGYREAWNSPLTQAIRTDLAAGRFHQYCLDSPACPIVRKAEQAGEMSMIEQSVAQVSRRWHLPSGRFWNVLRPMLRPVKWMTIRAGRAISDPGYIPRHLRRLLRG